MIDHYGQTIVRARYDGEYDKTDLPDELILTNYFSVRDRKIVSLIIIHNTPANLGTLATDVPARSRRPCTAGLTHGCARWRAPGISRYSAA